MTGCKKGKSKLKCRPKGPGSDPAKNPVLVQPKGVLQLLCINKAKKLVPVSSI